MKHKLSILSKSLGVALILSYAPAARAQSAADPVTTLQQVAAELRALKHEILSFRLETQEQTIATLERELAEVRKKQVRVQGEERVFAQQVAQLDEQLAGQALTQDDRMQVEASRLRLATEGAQRLRAEQAELNGQENSMQQRLAAARQRAEMLGRQVRQLMADATQQR